LLNKTRCVIVCLAFLFFITGCTTKAVKSEYKCQKITVENSSNIFGFSPSDTDFFMGALSCLGDTESVNNYQAAKEQLEVIVQKYPNSKWKESSQALISILQNMAELNVNLQRSATDKSKLGKEIEELKNDIQRLKNLEIQLEKREKNLK
jgi:hypothetical protein